LFKTEILFINDIFLNFNLKYNGKNSISWLIMNFFILWKRITDSIIKKQVDSETFFQAKTNKINTSYSKTMINQILFFYRQNQIMHHYDILIVSF
jgi:hypothetical protein